MDTLEAIRTRRSVRKYRNEPLPSGAVETLLEAARWAPSGLNNQPWRFLFVTDAAQREGLASFTKYGAIIRGAPAAAAVFLSLKTSYHREKDLMALGAAIQNLMLAARALGLGSCWLGEILNRRNEVREFLGVGEVFELVAVVTLGFPLRAPLKGRRLPVEKLIL